MKIRQLQFFFLAIFFVLILSGCGSSSATKEDKVIKIGATAGPYSDQVTEGIKPLLEDKGYDVEVVEYTDYVQPNLSLDQGDIDANVFQNSLYMKDFAETRGLDIIEAIKVPTAPIAIYSEKHDSIDDVEDGQSIATSNDPVNQARALAMLEDLGWIKLKEGVDPTKASEKDIAEYIKKVEIKPLEPAQLPRAMSDVDYSFVNGNFAISSGLKLNGAVYLEKTPPHYMIGVTVRESDEDAQFVKDIIEAYQSESFKKLNEEDEKYEGYVLPEWMN
ncbi:MetQ/NlpA family ABC transporter substrate-binding protein [Cytobacillus purgationiresistens]|uniref:D-methionine transport system substrate-binding protein n=1 Tax=Cytobacillus purgationiresistens TaxID=863449 RepID=A0ABU0ANK8_9BACI|nr:MetQ/NlpA family ABC transporter substrate-binding protein [Cytobacillus purgationiresistens]MDQ0272877.1 D-methionine transport system substrate-binding protein [Cytobacillus purgationiresistens]